MLFDRDSTWKGILFFLWHTHCSHDYGFQNGLFQFFQWLLGENWVHWDPCSLEVCLYHEGSTEVVLNVLRSGQSEMGIKQTLLWSTLIDVQSADSRHRWRSGQSFNVSIFWGPLNIICRLWLHIFFHGHADDIINEMMNTHDGWLSWAALCISSLPRLCLSCYLCLLILSAWGICSL